MNLDKILSIASAIVGVAAIATFVQSPNSASVIRAVGESFSGAIKAAQGR